MPKKTANGRTTKTIGQVIKEARIKLKLTADEVGEACNVSRSRIYQWEAGNFVFPKNLKLLAAALRLSKKRLETVNGPPPGRRAA
jgi:transcriptional regulator with XRE-family HTH domain